VVGVALYSTGLDLGARLVAVSRPGRRLFERQAWHLLTSTFVLRRRRGACSHQPSFCVAGAALGDIGLGFAWQAWRLWHWAGSGGALGRR